MSESDELLPLALVLGVGGRRERWVRGWWWGVAATGVTVAVGDHPHSGLQAADLNFSCQGSQHDINLHTDPAVSSDQLSVLSSAQTRPPAAASNWFV